MSLDFNWLSVAISVVGSVIIGTLWFGPKLFGEIYIQGLGFKSSAEAMKAFKKEPNAKRNMYITYGFQFVASFIVAGFVSTLKNLANGAGAYAFFFVLTFIVMEYSIMRWHGKSEKFNAVSIGGQVVILLYYIAIYHLVGPQLTLAF
ncbi:MAG: DUF1761 family protein [Alphaproteobacteria bacterium]|nr:DUF1761 family protein [Alphaproteobacteria bacterium]